MLRESFGTYLRLSRYWELDYNQPLKMKPNTYEHRTKETRRRIAIGQYMAAVFLFWVALFLYMPTLPVYLESRTGNLAMVGTVLSMFGLWQVFARLPLGILSDWWGRRKTFIIAGFLMAALGAWLLGNAVEYPALLIGRSITGLSSSVWVLLLVAFSSLFRPEDAVRATSLLLFVNSAGRVLATSSTGFLNNLGGYTLAFQLSAGAAVLGAVLLLPAHESRLPVKRRTMRGIGRLITRRDVLVPSLLNMVSQYTTWATTFGFVPVLAQKLGADDVALGFLMSLNIVVVMAGTLLVTTIVKRIGSRRLVIVSVMLITAGLLAATLAKSMTLIYVAQICAGLAGGTGYPALMGMSIEKVDEADRSTAMGLHQSLVAVGVFSGSWISGIIAEAIGIQPMFAITTVGFLAAVWFIMRWYPAAHK